MLAIVIIALLAEQDATAIGKRHPAHKDCKQGVLLGNIGSLGKEIPKHGSGQASQIKGRIGLDLGILWVVKGLCILLTSRLFVLAELIAHEETGLAHGRQANMKGRALEINDLDQTSLGRHTLQRAIHVVVHELPRGRNLQDIVAMEVIVRKGKIALGPCQRKDHLGHLCCMMAGIGIGLQEVLQCALTLLHHGGHDGDIRDLGPCKGLIAILTGILPKTRGIRTTIT